MKKRDAKKQAVLEKRTAKRAQYEKERKKKYALTKAKNTKSTSSEE